MTILTVCTLTSFADAKAMNGRSKVKNQHFQSLDLCLRGACYKLIMSRKQQNEVKL